MMRWVDCTSLRVADTYLRYPYGFALENPYSPLHLVFEAAGQLSIQERHTLGCGCLSCSDMRYLYPSRPLRSSSGESAAQLED